MSVLETLEICFQANLNGVDGQLARLGDQLEGIGDSVRPVGLELRRGLEDAVRQAGAASAGRALAEGFASGVRSGGGAVNGAVTNLVNAATRKIRTLLDIHSPSRVAEGFGAYFGEGFAAGIVSGVGDVEQAAAMLSGAAGAGLAEANLPETEFSGMDAAVERALGGVQLTIPLTVDGMKLGEASIRGINAVTKSAGRLLLNI